MKEQANKTRLIKQQQNLTKLGSGKTFIRVRGISVAILLTGPDRFAFSILNALVKT